MMVQELYDLTRKEGHDPRRVEILLAEGVPAEGIPSKADCIAEVAFAGHPEGRRGSGGAYLNQCRGRYSLVKLKRLPQMKKAHRQALIDRINRKDWWHVPPVDPHAYEKRGKFYASTFREAEFWGRPLDTPERVQVENPLIGDEAHVEKVLFGKILKHPDLNLDKTPHPRVVTWRFGMDAKMRKLALARGYDAIVILSRPGFKKLRTQGRLPISIELNILRPTGV